MHLGFSRTEWEKLVKNHDSNLTIDNSSLDSRGLAVCTLDAEIRRRLERAERIARSIPQPKRHLQRRASFTAISKNPLIGESSFLRSDEVADKVWVLKVNLRKKKTKT